jgi:hypothetical protein
MMAICLVRTDMSSSAFGTCLGLSRIERPFRPGSDGAGAGASRTQHVPSRAGNWSLHRPQVKAAPGKFDRVAGGCGDQRLCFH